MILTTQELADALTRVKVNGHVLKELSSKFQHNREVVLAAINQNGYALCYASEILKNDREIVLAAVSSWGGVLRFVSQSFRDDREIVLAALSESALSFKYASDRLKKDKDIVYTAMFYDYNVLEFIPETLKGDPVVVFLNKKALSVIDHDWPLVKQALLDNPDYFINPEPYMKALTADMDYPYVMLAQYALSKNAIIEPEPYPEINLHVN